MKTAAMVLGIVGGALGFLFAILSALNGVLVSTFMNNIGSYFDSSDLQQAFSVSYITVFIPGILCLFGSVMGLVGGLLVRSKRIASGVLMIVGSVLCVFTGLGIVSLILLVLGGIFALVREKQTYPPQQAYMPYPPQQYPLYPSQQYPPYPPQEASISGASVPGSAGGESDHPQD